MTMGPAGVFLKNKYESQNPWPSGVQPNVLFLLDTHNSFEQELLRGWIHHHGEGEAIQVPQVELDLRNEQREIDSTPLVAALDLPDDTLVTPLRVTWMPSQEAINSPGFRRSASPQCAAGEKDSPGSARANASAAGRA
mgnify:CR=1 FL=1